MGDRDLRRPGERVGAGRVVPVTNSDNGLFAFQPAISASGELTYTPKANANGVATITVTIRDDGGTANGGDDAGATETFEITVTAVNSAPSFTRGPNQTVDEDAGLQTVSNWATGVSPGPADESAQAVDFVASADNAALFSSGPSVAPDGTLVYTPAANANGSATVTVFAHDSGGGIAPNVDVSGLQTFTITIAPINDTPGRRGNQ